MALDHADAHAAYLDRSPGHGLLWEGLVTGLIGAGAVALWFLVVDLAQGRPLYTPALLGGLVTGSAEPAAAALGGGRVALAGVYTVVHLLAFVLVGVVAVFLVHRAQRTPALLGLLLMLFAAIEVGVIAFVAVLDVQAIGSLAWYQVAIGNLLAAVVMGTYLVRRHAGLGVNFGRALADRG
jgi:hypothetical protein